MKRRTLRTLVFVALLSLLQPVIVSANEVVQLAQDAQVEQVAAEEVVELEQPTELTTTPTSEASEESNIDETVPSETESPTEPTSPESTTETSTAESTTETTTSTTEESTTETSSSQPVEESKPPKEQPAKPVAPSERPPKQPVITQEQSPDYYEQGTYTPENVVVGGEMTITFNNTTEEFIKKIGPLASKIADENDLYASVMIAQAILESGSGNSGLAGIPNYNLFGIKGAYKGKSVSMGTQEDHGNGTLYSTVASFRRYPSYKESLEDYAGLLTKGLSGNDQFYQGTWKSKTSSYQEATAFLTGKYATDTLYASKLNGLIKTYKLTTYDDYDKSMEELLKTMSAGPGEEKLAKVALSYLNTPYIWGGTTPVGFDCSGLVQYVYREAAGIELPRVTWQQEQVGQEVGLDELKTGDLLFFGTRGATHHVAMYLDNGLFIHAPEPGDVVKITSISEFKPDFAKRLVIPQ